MKTFDNGVGWYTNAMLYIHFPQDDVCCAQCPFCKPEWIDSKVNRFWCKANRNNVIPTNVLTGISDDCPLEIKKGECYE